MRCYAPESTAQFRFMRFGFSFTVPTTFCCHWKADPNRNGLSYKCQLSWLISISFLFVTLTLRPSPFCSRCSLLSSFLFSLFRRYDGLFGQRVLLAPRLRGAYHVSVIQRPCGGAAAQAATLCDRIFLSARQISDWGELGAVVRTHGRIQRKVSTTVHTYTHSQHPTMLARL